MKKYVVLICLALMLSSVVFAFGGPAPKKPSSSEIGNIDGLIMALKDGQPAKAINTTTVNIMGMLQTTKTYLETKDIADGKCTLYIENQKNDLKFSDEMVKMMKDGGSTQSEIDAKEKEAKLRAKEAEGRHGTAIFQTSDLLPLLEKWKAGNFSSRDWKSAEEKSGPMFE